MHATIRRYDGSSDEVESEPGPFGVVAGGTLQVTV
jgi:hypothetical protein